jgi:hypothetical protein
LNHVSSGLLISTKHLAHTVAVTFAFSPMIAQTSWKELQKLTQARLSFSFTISWVEGWFLRQSYQILVTSPCDFCYCLKLRTFIFSLKGSPSHLPLCFGARVKQSEGDLNTSTTT